MRQGWGSSKPHKFAAVAQNYGASCAAAYENGGWQIVWTNYFFALLQTFLLLLLLLLLLLFLLCCCCCCWPHSLSLLAVYCFLSRQLFKHFCLVVGSVLSLSTHNNTHTHTDKLSQINLIRKIDSCFVLCTF